MKVEFYDQNQGNKISINNDTLKTDGDIVIDLVNQDSEAWYAFNSVSEFAEFAEFVNRMLKDMRKHHEK